MQLAPKCDDRGVEALEVTDLQHSIVPGRGRDELASLSERLGDRLLDEHVQAVLEARHRDRVMKRRRRRDADRVHVPEQLAEIGDGPTVRFLRDTLPRRGVGVDHGNELRRLERDIFLGVKASQIAHADDRSSHF
jgi:hypothetical protein